MLHAYLYAGCQALRICHQLLLYCHADLIGTIASSSILRTTTRRPHSDTSVMPIQHMHPAHSLKGRKKQRRHAGSGAAFGKAPGMQAICLQLPELLLSGQRTCCMWTWMHVSGPSCSLSLSRSLYDWSAGIVDTKHWLDVCWSELLGAACTAGMDGHKEFAAVQQPHQPAIMGTCDSLSLVPLLLPRSSANQSPSDQVKSRCLLETEAATWQQRYVSTLQQQNRV